MGIEGTDVLPAGRWYEDLRRWIYTGRLTERLVKHIADWLPLLDSRPWILRGEDDGRYVLELLLENIIAIGWVLNPRWPARDDPSWLRGGVPVDVPCWLDTVPELRLAARALALQLKGLLDHYSLWEAAWPHAGVDLALEGPKQTLAAIDRELGRRGWYRLNLRSVGAQLIVRAWYLRLDAWRWPDVPLIHRGALASVREAGRRFGQRAEDVLRLIQETSPSAPPAPPTLPKDAVAEDMTSAGQPTTATPQAPDQRETESEFVARAVAFILANQGLTTTEYARRLNRHRSTIYNHPIIRATIESTRGNRGRLAKGYRKDDGSLEAYQDT